MLHLFVKFSAGHSLSTVVIMEKDNSTKRCKDGGRGGGFGLPLSAGSSMVGEARPREGMLGNRTEPGKAIQGCSALCRPVERERAIGMLPRCQEARDIQRMKGQKAPEYNLQPTVESLNIGNDVDLKQHQSFRTGSFSETNRDIEATRRHRRAPQNWGTGHKTTLKPEILQQLKVCIEIAAFGSEPPGNLHTWKSRLFSKLLWNEQIWKVNNR